MVNKPKFGPTGKYPLGKLRPTDEGELRFGVAHDKAGNVHLNFGKKVAWLAMPADKAINLARVILKHAGAKKVEIEL